MADINFLNASDVVDKLVQETNLEQLPPGTKRQALIGTVADWDKESVEHIIAQIHEDGLPFAWVHLSKDKPPYCLIDLQHSETKIILPPFLYIVTNELESLVTTNGSYIVFDTEEGTEHVWTPEHKVEIDKNGFPTYKDKELLNVADIACSETKH